MPKQITLELEKNAITTLERGGLEETPFVRMLCKRDIWFSHFIILEAKSKYFNLKYDDSLSLVDKNEQMQKFLFMIYDGDNVTLSDYLQLKEVYTFKNGGNEQ